MINDAERRVRNEFGDREADVQPVAHAERVNRRMEALRENHECQVHTWSFRHGCGECEECGDFLAVFLMVSHSSGCLWMRYTDPFIAALH